MKAKWKRAVSALLTLCLTFTFAVYPAAAAERREVSSSASVAEEAVLYTGPSAIYSQAAVLPTGTGVIVNEVGDSDWYRVTAGDKTGYIEKNKLQIPVSSISLDSDRISLKKGTSRELKAVVSPDFATNTQVAWNSGAPLVAEVNQQGKVTALSPGTAVIYVQSADGSGALASCVVTVEDDTVGNIGLNQPSARVAKGKKLVLSASIGENPVAGESLIWTSSNTTVASVTDGIVTGKAAGQAVITVKNTAGTLMATCPVTVYVPTTKITLSASALSLKSGQEQTLTAMCSPEDATNKEIMWKSENPEVASVDAGGKVTANSPGTVKIIARTADGSCQAACTVTVTATIKMHSSNVTLRKGQTYYNKTTADVAAKNLVWTSSNPSVAKASTNGFIDGVGVGTATVYASYNGEKVACKVTVTAEEPVLRAYTTPNVAAPNTNVSFVVITSTAQTSVRIMQVDGGKETQIASATSGYVDQSYNGRKVRIWTLTKNNGFVMPSGQSYYVYNLKAYAGSNTTEGKAFTACVVSAAADPSNPVVTKRRTTDASIAFRMEYEGFSPTVYYDAVSLPTIGYGNLLNAGDTFYNNMTKEEAKAEMITLINGVYTSELNTFTTRFGVALTQYQFDALLNFTYNYGQSRWRCYDFYLRRLLLKHKNGNAIDTVELKHAFGQCSYAGGFLVGLFRGRIDEWQMFIRADYEVHPYISNSVSMVGEFALPTAEERQEGGIYASDMEWIGYQY